MKTIYYMYLPLALLFFVLCSCESGVNEPAKDNPAANINKIKSSVSGKFVYYNSFETEQDTSGWTGVISQMFVKDPAPDAGEKSLLIGGGCPQPAGFRSITIEQEGYYNINFWGKTANLGGSIIVTAVSGNYAKSHLVDINKRDWNQYKIKSLYCLANSKINIEIMAGGFVPADINLDELSVEKSGKHKQAELSAK